MSMSAVMRDFADILAAHPEWGQVSLTFQRSGSVNVFLGRRHLLPLLRFLGGSWHNEGPMHPEQERSIYIIKGEYRGHRVTLFVGPKED